MGTTLGKIGIVFWSFLFVISLVAIATYNSNEESLNKELGIPKESPENSATAIGLSFMFITLPSALFGILSYRHYVHAKIKQLKQQA